MKKFLSFAGVSAFILAVALFANSCSKDQERAMVLSGEWTGDFGMYYECEYLGNDGMTYTAKFDSYDTDIAFYPDHEYATHGYGYQVDFYDDGPYTKQSFKFYWDVDHGRIKLTYPGYPEYNTTIRDYHLDRNSFTGFFDTGTQMFKLHKIADYYDWTPYYGYEFHYWVHTGWTWDSYYYYAKTRGVNVDRETLPTEFKPENVKITKIGNRFAK